MQSKPSPFACGPNDLRAYTDHMGMLYVLIEVEGWRVSRRWRPTPGTGPIVMEAHSTSYGLGVNGDDEGEATYALFTRLFSDEPDAIAGAGAFWPRPEPNVVLLSRATGGEPDADVDA